MFTFAHISDQRSEGSNSSYKGNGTLKKLIATATLDQSVNRFIQVADYREIEKVAVIKALCEKNQIVSDKFIAFLNESNIQANKLSEVAKVTSDPNDLTYLVLRTNLDSEISTVCLKGSLKFSGIDIACTTCTCPFFTSSRIICSCGCIAAQRAGFNIKDAANFYPLYSLSRMAVEEQGFPPLLPICPTTSP